MIQQLSITDAIAQVENQSFSQKVIEANPDQKPQEPKTAQMAEQLMKVYMVMKDGRWRTLAEIAFYAKTPEASASARLRDLRKKGFIVSKRKAPDGKLFQYQLSGSIPC